MKGVFSLQAKQGGLGIMNMSDAADWEYENSRIFTEELTEMIFEQQNIMKLNQKKMEETARIVETRKIEYHAN